MVLEMDLKREVLRLLKEDEEFRLTVAGLVGLDTVLTELRKLREDFNKFVEIEGGRWEGLGRELFSGCGSGASHWHRVRGSPNDQRP